MKSVLNQVWDVHLCEQISNQVCINQVWDQIYVQVGNQLWNQVWNQVWNQAREDLK